MKRIIILALLLLVIASGAFALDKAFGFGALYNHSFTMGSWEDNWYESGGYYYDTDWTLTRNGLGGFIFLGLGRYIELNVGFLYKNPIHLIEKDSDGDVYEYQGGELNEWWKSAFAFQGGVYFKYPIPISDTFVFFPTIGADFEYTLSSEDEWWWNDLWLRGGVGLDIFLSQTMFLRTHLIYGAALPVGAEPDWGIKFSHGALVKLGLGWMF